MKRICNLKAEQLVAVIDLFGAGEEEREQEFIKSSTGLKFMICKNNGAFDITNNTGNDCFYNVSVSDSEFEQLAVNENAVVENYTETEYYTLDIKNRTLTYNGETCSFFEAGLHENDMESNDITDEEEIRDILSARAEENDCIAVIEFV
jgi:hypothetical protein